MFKSREIDYGNIRFRDGIDLFAEKNEIISLRLVLSTVAHAYLRKASFSARNSGTNFRCLFKILEEDMKRILQ